MVKNRKKKCKLCGELTQTVYNINLKAVPVCNDCGRMIFIQQAMWYNEIERDGYIDEKVLK